MNPANELSLIPVTVGLKVAFARSRSAFGRAVGLPLPAAWPQFPEAFGLIPGRESDPRWGGYLFARAGRVVGNGGFTGPPDAQGAVEIGYEIAPAEWNRGHASEAARQLVDLAWRNGAARVIAHTAAEWNASNRVLGKVGMAFVRALPNDELGTVWRFAVDRDAAGGSPIS